MAPLLALGAIPILAAVGTAVDYGRANGARTSMQNALDATALMMAKDSESASNSNPSSQASQYFYSNFARTDLQSLALSVNVSPGNLGTTVKLSATALLPTTFLGVLGFSGIPISVSSQASTNQDGLGCVLSLNRSASAAISAQGSTSISLTGCSLYDNSNASDALAAGGSAQISALSVGVVGGVSGSSNIATMAGIKTGLGPIADPYANDSFPAFSGCTVRNFTAKSVVTIDPGVYCGGMKLNAGADVTLNPGIYYLDGGGLTVNGGAKISGTGVTLVFTKQNSSTWATADINGGATVNLSAPKSGPTAGIVVFADRNMPNGTVFKLNGGSSQYFGGAVYIPTGEVDYAGGAGTSTSCTQLIGDTVQFTGSSSVAINCSNYSTKPFSAVTIKLSQ